MPQLSYAVDADLKRLRLYFDELNPIESAILKQALVQYKMFGYKVPGTSLICIELALTDKVAQDFAAYTQKKETEVVKPKKKNKKVKVSK